MRRNALVALVLGLVLPASVSLASSIVTNGSFEAPVVSYPYATQPPASPDGWTVASGTIDLIHGYWQSQDGDQSIDLDGVSAGSIYQDLATVAGQQYKLSFWVAGNPDAASLTKAMAVDFGSPLLTVSYSNPTGTLQNMGWTQVEWLATATSSTTRLQFTSLTEGSYGMALDNVAVTAVPLPAAAWAGMALMGIVGAAKRIRRSA